LREPEKHYGTTQVAPKQYNSEVKQGKTLERGKMRQDLGLQ